MTMKRNARVLKKNIFEHHKRTSTVYEEMAQAPEWVVASFLEQLPNILVRKYAVERIKSIQMDIALARIDQLDPTPFEHQHVLCPVSGMRFPEPESEHDIFSPREGFIVDREAYTA